MNMQPSEAQAGFDIRVPPTADPASLERRIADEWAPASRNMTFEVLGKIIILTSTLRDKQPAMRWLPPLCYILVLF